MTLVAELTSCDGFTVESPEGRLGRVEETWLDDAGRAAALALRTAAGGRALLLADAVRGVDADAQAVFVAADAVLRGLQPPRLESLDGDPSASWRASGTFLAAAAARSAPAVPAVASARLAPDRVGRPLWQTLALALGGLALLVAVEIGLAFGIAYLVTGRLT